LGRWQRTRREAGIVQAEGGKVRVNQYLLGIGIFLACSTVFAQEQEFPLHVGKFGDFTEASGAMGYQIWGESDTATYSLRCTLFYGTDSPIKNEKCLPVGIGSYIARRKGPINLVIKTEQGEAVYYIKAGAEKTRSEQLPCKGVTPLNIALFVLWVGTLIWGVMWCRRAARLKRNATTGI